MDVDPRLARRLASFNKHVTNRLTTPLAPHLPAFGVVTHAGPHSGRTYRTPVNVFPRDSGFVFALTYGRDAQWVQNVIEAGGCELTTRGRTYALTHPEIFHDASRHAAAPVARPMLRLVGGERLHVDEPLDSKLITLSGPVPRQRGIRSSGNRSNRRPCPSGGDDGRVTPNALVLASRC